MENIRILAEKEKFRKFLGIEIVNISEGYAKVALKTREYMTNIYDFIHGGIIFSLADEAFELACNSRGHKEVGLNVNISYVRASKVEDMLFAEAEFITETKRMAIYKITIINQNNEILATCHANSYKISKL